MHRILPLDAATYRRHAIHGEGRIWAETNCYSDVIVELLHGAGFEPAAALPFTLTIDHDVNHWTFFKFPHADVSALYAWEIFEMAPWPTLYDCVEAQVAAGRPVLVELDSYFLPDTEGTAWRREHVKSTVAVNLLDRDARRMGYFHNQGYFELQGDDFDDIFQLGGLVHPRMLPPYVEFVKPAPRRAPLRGAALVDGSLRLLREHLGRLPGSNPFPRFRARFEHDAAALDGQGIEAFHAYAFVTLRMYGANFELAATCLRWLAEQGVDLPPEPEADLTWISTNAKALQLQLARAIVRRRPLDLTPLDEAATRWDRAMGTLVGRFA